MKVKELIRELKKFNPEATVRFHLSYLHNLQVLSVYSKGNHSRTKFVEIDITGDKNGT